VSNLTKETIMTNRITQQATSLALAVLVTISILAGLAGLAASEVASVQARLAPAETAQRG
jgi:hypothetical protein